MTTKQAEKLLDAQIERAYGILATGKQIDIMDIGKVYKGAREDVSRGLSVVTAVQNQVDRYCM